MKKNLFFVLDNVRSAFNVGSIFRTSLVFDYKVILIGVSPTPDNNLKVLKTSLGEDVGKLSYKYFSSFHDFMNNFNSKRDLIISVEELSQKFQGKSISLADEESLLKIFESSHSENIYFIFGHEVNGVSDNFLEVSNKIIYISSYGMKSSINVGVTAGIIGFNIRNILSKLS